MSFSGTIESDFMKLIKFPEDRKAQLINYAATDFEEIKLSLLSYINAVYPEDFTNFSESDLGVMLLELVAYMGAVLSFKTDAVANESYLSTVKNRNNLNKLLELIGIRLKGPASASARGRLTFNSPTAPTDVQVAEFTFGGNNRTFSVESPEDGGTVSYTLYKLDSNDTIKDIENANDSLVFYGADDSDNGIGAGGLSSIYSGMAIVEGAYTIETGRFDATEQVKTITLAQNPVIERSVRVFVNSTIEADAAATGAYLEVDNLFSASASTGKLFQVSLDIEGNTTLLFGDGTLSQNPPQGALYTVSYRVGGGTRGNLTENSLNILLSDDAGLGWRLVNTTPMTGGANAETAAQVRRYAPYVFKTQDRLVTLEDYIAFCNRFISSSSAKGIATAVTREAFSSANIIDIYVLERATDFAFQKASPSFKESLLKDIDPKKMITDQAVVNDGLIRTLDLVISLKLDREYKEIEPEIKALASTAVLEFFNVDNLQFGEEFVKVELERKLFQIPQIRFSTVENTGDRVAVDFNEIIQLNNFSFDIVYL